jgi:hypothetical protein
VGVGVVGAGGGLYWRRREGGCGSGGREGEGMKGEWTVEYNYRDLAYCNTNLLCRVGMVPYAVVLQASHPYPHSHSHQRSQSQCLHGSKSEGTWLRQGRRKQSTRTMACPDVGSSTEIGMCIVVTARKQPNDDMIPCVGSDGVTA